MEDSGLRVFRLHPNNVVGVRSFGDQFMCTSLVEACNKYIQKYFVDVAQSDEFLSLEQKDIVEILSNDELHVASEEQVLHAIFCMNCFIVLHVSCFWCFWYCFIPLLTTIGITCGRQ